MKFLIWIINKILPITSFVGILCLILFELAFPISIYIACAVSFILGVFFGVAAWNYDVPPRWFWVKSKMELFDNKIGYSLGYGARFFWLPIVIYAICVCL